MLEGKAKKLFDEWHLVNYPEFHNEGYKMYCQWHNMSESMQFGVIQDFADSLGYKIIINYANSDWWFYEFVGVRRLDSFRDTFKSCNPTRHQARTAAIEKLNELINKGL